MNKFVFAILFTFAGVSSVHAADTRESRFVTMNQAFAATAPITFSRALDKVGREYKEMWIKDRLGKKMRRSCDFQCSNFCEEERNACYTAGYGSQYCEYYFEVCMCENQCCNLPGLPGGGYCP